MTSPETLITLSPEQFYILLAALGGAVAWITRKITRLEDKIKKIEENPLLEAFRETQVVQAKRLLNLEKNIKGFEAQKVRRNGEEKK